MRSLAFIAAVVYFFLHIMYVRRTAKRTAGELDEYLEQNPEDHLQLKKSVDKGIATTVFNKLFPGKPKAYVIEKEGEKVKMLPLNGARPQTMLITHFDKGVKRMGDRRTGYTYALDHFNIYLKLADEEPYRLLRVTFTKYPNYKVRLGSFKASLKEK